MFSMWGVSSRSISFEKMTGKVISDEKSTPVHAKSGKNAL
jgi:hypothetical protein